MLSFFIISSFLSFEGDYKNKLIPCCFCPIVHIAPSQFTKTVDVQAHSASHSDALEACISAIFGKRHRCTKRLGLTPRPPFWVI